MSPSQTGFQRRPLHHLRARQQRHTFGLDAHALQLLAVLLQLPHQHEHLAAALCLKQVYGVERDSCIAAQFCPSDHDSRYMAQHAGTHVWQ